MIPKIIHYCWFGEKSKPKLIQDCIRSWKIYLPEYEIIEWNEKNSDLSHPFVKEAYKQKKWAFVADFIRLKVLYGNGGIYLDTDMMVLKGFDDLLLNNCFLGKEDENFINAAIVGAEKNNKFILECLSRYQSINIEKEMNWGLITIPIIITDVFKNGKEISLCEISRYDDIVIYPVDYFYPLACKNRTDIENYRKYLTANSFAVHLWSGSWNINEFQYLRKGQYFKGLKICLKNVFIHKKTDVVYFRKIASSVKESLVTKSWKN